MAGLSLVELLVVLIVLGIGAALIYPRVANLSETYLKKDAERAAGLIEYLSEASATRKLYYRVWFDLNKDIITVEASKDGQKFYPETDSRLSRLRFTYGVEIEDLILPGTGKASSGDVTYVLSPSYTPDPLALHLKAGDKHLTLTFNPYSGKVAVEDGYIVSYSSGAWGFR
jgi:prepilin-type N-terminal cleavage/methylation domain-containing protein